MALIPAQVAVLQELARGPSWADGLLQRIRDGTGGQLNLSRGNVVPALQMLLRDKLIEPAGEEPRSDLGGTPKRLYRITAKGEKRAAEDRGKAAAVLGWVVNGSPTKAAAAPVEKGPVAERFVVLDREAKEAETE